jgi:DNA-binding NarL/FixJ family response regulator
VPAARVFLAELPPLLAGIVRSTLAATPGLEVVGEGGADAAAAAGSDVVLAEAPGAGLTDSLHRLLYRHSRMKVLTISPDGRRAALWRLVPDRRALAEVSPGSLVEALRAAAAED